MATTITAQIDEDAIDAESIGHDLYCYEVNMELLWEKGIIEGPHDPKLLAEILGAIGNGTLRCECEVDE